MTVNYSTFIFDFDGTLADTIDIFTEVVEIVKADYGHSLSETQPLSYYRQKDMRQLFKDFGIKKWQIPGLVKKIHTHFKQHVDRVNYFPEIPSVLKQLKAHNIQLGIVSSNEAETINQFLSKQVFNDFAFVYGGVAVFGKHRKLRRVLRQEGLNQEDVLYFGDQVRDIEACHNIGLDVCAVSWGFNAKEKLQEANPDHLIDKPRQTLDLIAGQTS